MLDSNTCKFDELSKWVYIYASQYANDYDYEYREEYSSTHFQNEGFLFCYAFWLEQLNTT